MKLNIIKLFILIILKNKLKQKKLKKIIQKELNRINELEDITLKEIINTIKIYI